MSDLRHLAARLARVCQGWALRRTPEGYVLSPPDGDEAVIRTRASLDDWLRHQERWAGVEVQLEMELEYAA